MFRLGADIALSDVIPLLENMGLKVLTEHLYEIDADGGRLYIQDIEVQPVAALRVRHRAGARDVPDRVRADLARRRRERLRSTS